MSLARQFALAGGAVMVFAVLAVGLWVSRWIEEVVVRNTANATALYMESFIAPVMQDLATRERRTPEAWLEIDRLRTDPEGGRHQSPDSRCRRAGRSIRPPVSPCNSAPGPA